MLTAGGEPVWGATVRPLSADAGDSRARVWPSAAETDELGRFALAGLPAGSHRLSIVSSAGVETAAPVLVGPGAGPATIALGERGAALTVRIVDPEGPVRGGAVVQLVPDGGTVRRRARTDASGEARFAGLALGKYRVRAEAAGHAATADSSWAPIATTVEWAGDSREPVVLAARARGGLQLEVADVRGEPVPGLAVELWRRGSSVDLIEGQLDDRGRALWTDLPAGTYALTPADPAAADAPLLVDVPPGRVARERLILNAAAVVRVRVLRDGSPLAGAEVGLAPTAELDALLMAAAMRGRTVATDGLGRAALVALGPGPHVVFARSGPGRPPTTRVVDFRASSREIDVELAAGTVSGRIATTGSLASARVRLVPERVPGEGHCALAARRERDPQEVASSAADQTIKLRQGEVLATPAPGGELLFQEVPSGHYRVEIELPRHQPWTSRPFPLGAGSLHDLGELEPVPLCRLSGRVEGLPAGHRPPVVKLIEDATSREWRQPAAEDGAYAFEVPPGVYRLKASAEAWRHEGESFEVTPSLKELPAIEMSRAPDHRPGAGHKPQALEEAR